MTALAEPQVAATMAEYEVQYPETGEVLGYVSLSPGTYFHALGRALRQNGLRLAPVGSSFSPRLSVEPLT
jgi:hypothetical protein